jgi:hypothetical protein
MVFLQKGVGKKVWAPEGLAKLRPNCVWMAAINDCSMNSESPNVEASTLPEFARKLELDAINRRINRLAPLTIF